MLGALQEGGALYLSPGVPNAVGAEPPYQVTAERKRQCRRVESFADLAIGPSRLSHLVVSISTIQFEEGWQLQVLAMEKGCWQMEIG